MASYYEAQQCRERLPRGVAAPAALTGVQAGGASAGVAAAAPRGGDDVAPAVAAAAAADVNADTWPLIQFLLTPTRNPRVTKCVAFSLAFVLSAVFPLGYAFPRLLMHDCTGGRGLCAPGDTVCIVATAVSTAASLWFFYWSFDDFLTGVLGYRDVLTMRRRFSVLTSVLNDDADTFTRGAPLFCSCPNLSLRAVWKTCVRMLFVMLPTLETAAARTPGAPGPGGEGPGDSGAGISDGQRLPKEPILKLQLREEVRHPLQLRVRYCGCRLNVMSL